MGGRGEKERGREGRGKRARKREKGGRERGRGSYDFNLKGSVVPKGDSSRSRSEIWIFRFKDPSMFVQIFKLSPQQIVLFNSMLVLLNDVLQGRCICIPNDFYLLRNRRITYWRVKGIIRRKGYVYGDFSIFAIKEE